MLIAAALVGCAPKATTVAMPEGTPPDWPTIQARWNARANSIKAMHGHGIFETRWTDKQDRAHVDQGDLDLWYLHPDQLATRISKFGDTYAVTGMNRELNWVYLEGESSVFYYGDLDKYNVLSIYSIPVDPWLYRGILGLAPLMTQQPPTISWDGDAGAWLIVLHGLTMHQPSRLWLRPGAMYPDRMEYNGNVPDRRIMVRHDHRRTRVIELPGEPVGNWPTFSNAMAIELYSGAHLESRSLVVFDRLSCDVEDEPVDRVFDMEVMIEGLVPDRIEFLGGDAP
jgi:hypothetical protein